MSLNLYKKDFSAASAGASGAMKKMSDVSKAVDSLSASQKKTFYETLKKHQGSGNALQQTLYELKANKKDGIESGKVNAMAKDLIKHGSRFAKPAGFGEKTTGRLAEVMDRINGPAPSYRPRISSAPMKSGEQLYSKKFSAIRNSGLVKN